MKATRDAFGDQLVYSGETNESIVALSADLGKATKINKFADAYPDRFFEIGIAENNMIFSILSVFARLISLVK